MSAIRVSGRKNSGINIAGFNSQDGENAYYCNCYNCCCLIDSSKEKKILSGVIKNSGTSCSTCRTKIAPACWLTKRRCMECQLFCKCSNCESDPLLVAKVPIWTVNEYRGCFQCGTACISSLCLEAEFLCHNCFVVLQELDMDCDDREDFGQIFEDGVAAASNSSVSKFTEAVTSIEASSVPEEVQSKIIGDLQQCIVGPVSKKLKADTRVNLARGFLATKKNSKKTPK